VSARQEELLDRAYAYVRTHGISDLSLRPLASAIGSSPRVLLYLFGSKDGLIRALLARGRAEQLKLRDAPDALAIWTWAADPARRELLTLWLDAYARSLTDPTGPWADFAARTVTDWLDILSDDPNPTATLAILRGAMLDLIATGDTDRITTAVRYALGATSGSRTDATPT